MITRLSLENYRAFDNLNIKLGKINLFLGPNNSGKSAILSALNVLSQTMQSTDADIPLLLNGKFEDLGSYVDVVHNNDLKKNIKIGIEFDVTLHQLEGQSTRHEIKSIEKARTGKLDWTFHYRQQRRETIVKEAVVEVLKENFKLVTKTSPKVGKLMIESINPPFKQIPPKWLRDYISIQHFLPQFSPRFLSKRLVRKEFINNLFTNKNFNEDVSRLFYIDDLSIKARELLNSIDFISPFRSRGERTYTFSGEHPSTVGITGDKAIHILVADQQRRGKKRQHIREQVSNWLQQAEIANDLHIKILSSRHFEIRLKHPYSNEEENLADVGFGCSQILPILVAGYSRPSDSILIIEQPEIHLHPRAQAELGTFLYDISKRNLQLFVETHSEHLLLRLLSYVAEGKLTPDDINVFYVYAKKDTHKKCVKLMSIGNDGIFKEKWPEGFFPERLREAKRLARFSHV
jgi:predicted ATPase